MYFDGVKLTVPATALTGRIGTTSGNIKIGRGYSSSYNMPANSYVDEVRVSNMVRYTANFTPQATAFCNPAAPVSAYNGPGDVVGAVPVAWWGLRAYNKTQASNAFYGTSIPIANLRRSADNATCDVLPDFTTGGFGTTTGCSIGGNNGLTYSGFCTSNCFVAKLYDQTGRNQCTGATACDLVQATAANQPQVVGCMATASCMAFTTSSQTLTSPAGPALSQPITVDALAQRTGAFTANGTFFVQGTTQTQFLYSNATNTVAINNGGTAATAAASDSAIHSLMGVYNGASSSIIVDTATAPGLTVPTTATAGVFNIGPGTSGNALTGQIAEVGVWASNRTADAGALCNNQFGYGYGTACGVVPACTANTQGGGTFANVVSLWHLDDLTDSSSGGHTLADRRTDQLSVARKLNLVARRGSLVQPAMASKERQPQRQFPAT